MEVPRVENMTNMMSVFFYLLIVLGSEQSEFGFLEWVNSLLVEKWVDLLFLSYSIFFPNIYTSERGS